MDGLGKQVTQMGVWKSMGTLFLDDETSINTELFQGKLTND